MKKLVFLISVLILVSGCAQIDQIQSNDLGKGIIEEVPIGDSETIRIVVSRELFVDRNKYVTGGTPFDVATVNFVQKANKGYEMDITTEKEVNAEVMTNEDCLLKGGDKAYNSIFSGEGKTINFINDETFEEDKDMCVFIKALENDEETVVNVKMDELTF